MLFAANKAENAFFLNGGSKKNHTNKAQVYLQWGTASQMANLTPRRAGSGSNQIGDWERHQIKITQSGRLS